MDSDITKEYICRRIFDYTQQNEKEMILACGVPGVYNKNSCENYQRNDTTMNHLPPTYPSVQGEKDWVNRLRKVLAESSGVENNSKDEMIEQEIKQMALENNKGATTGAER